GTTRALLDWTATNLHAVVRRAIITHAHADRIGGADELAARHIPFVAHAPACSRAVAAGKPVPDSLPGLSTGQALELDGLEIFEPGRAHAPGNITVWIPTARILFGGCVVRAKESKDLGNVADADPTAWGDAIHRLEERYPSVKTVVPGHGRTGSRKLLHHTHELLEELLREHD